MTNFQNERTYEVTGPARDAIDRGDAEAFRRLPDQLRLLALQGDITAVARIWAAFGEGAAGGKSGSYIQGRRSLALELADKGLLTEQKVALEILFLLPEGFLRMYEDLFHRAYRGGENSSVMHGRSGGLGRATGQQGMTLGSETGLQAKAGGKRWKNVSGLGIRSDKAMTVKEAVDQGLQDLARYARETLNPADDGTGRGNGQRRCGGTSDQKCGRFLKSGWRYCPACGASISSSSAAGRDSQP